MCLFVQTTFFAQTTFCRNKTYISIRQLLELQSEPWVSRQYLKLLVVLIRFFWKNAQIFWEIVSIPLFISSSQWPSSSSISCHVVIFCFSEKIYFTLTDSLLTKIIRVFDGTVVCIKICLLHFYSSLQKFSPCLWPAVREFVCLGRFIQNLITIPNIYWQRPFAHSIVMFNN